MLKRDSTLARRTASILVVDHDAEYQRLLSWLLEDFGYQTIAAPDGDTALELLTSGVSPSVVILDMSPLAKSKRTLAAMRADPRLAKLPVIVTPSEALESESARQATAVLPKPFDCAHLLSLLAEHCSPEARPRPRFAGPTTPPSARSRYGAAPKQSTEPA
jgi:CheY-like chemotaxis protein